MEIAEEVLNILANCNMLEEFGGQLAASAQEMELRSSDACEAIDPLRQETLCPLRQEEKSLIRGYHFHHLCSGEL